MPYETTAPPQDVPTAGSARCQQQEQTHGAPHQRGSIRSILASTLIKTATREITRTQELANTTFQRLTGRITPPSAQSEGGNTEKLAQETPYLAPYSTNTPSEGNTPQDASHAIDPAQLQQRLMLTKVAMRVKRADHLCHGGPMNSAWRENRSAVVKHALATLSPGSQTVPAADAASKLHAVAPLTASFSPQTQDMAPYSPIVGDQAGNNVMQSPSTNPINMYGPLNQQGRIGGGAFGDKMTEGGNLKLAGTSLMRKLATMGGTPAAPAAAASSSPASPSSSTGGTVSGHGWGRGGHHSPEKYRPSQPAPAPTGSMTMKPQAPGPSSAFSPGGPLGGFGKIGREMAVKLAMMPMAGAQQPQQAAPQQQQQAPAQTTGRSIAQIHRQLANSPKVRQTAAVPGQQSWPGQPAMKAPQQGSSGA